MVAWSNLLFSKGQRLLRLNGLLAKTVPKNAVVRRMSEHKTMEITPSNWQWERTKDWFHFYFMLGAIPVVVITFCTNVFIGPATLEPIPEGYTPKHWEYYRHPITRFLSRYFFPNHQQEYEKLLYALFAEEERRRLKLLGNQIKECMDNERDYKSLYYRDAYNAAYIKEYRKYLDSSTFISK